MAERIYAIRHVSMKDEDGQPMWWNNYDGWVSPGPREAFNAEERAEVDLPIDGEWVESQTVTVRDRLACWVDFFKEVQTFPGEDAILAMSDRCDDGEAIGFAIGDNLDGYDNGMEVVEHLPPHFVDERRVQASAAAAEVKDDEEEQYEAVMPDGTRLPWDERLRTVGACMVPKEMSNG
jgi:hypothetical protein